MTFDRVVLAAINSNQEARKTAAISRDHFPHYPESDAALQFP
jgi:hypothetical protein